MTELQIQPDQPKRLPLWPLVYCISPILLGLGLVLYVNWGKQPPANANQAPAIPSLGAGERPMATSQPDPIVDEPEETSAEPEKEPTTETEKPESTEPEIEPVIESTVREIDIYIKRLSHAAKVRDSKGIKSSTSFLEKASPAELVDERLLFALQSEQNAFARMALFETFRSGENALSWADSVFTSKYSKYTGDDSNFSQGEQAELLGYGLSIIGSLRQVVDYASNSGFTAFLKNLGQTQSPEWAWHIVLRLAEQVVFATNNDLGKAFGPSFDDALRKGVAKFEKAKILFLIWARQYSSSTDLLNAMVLPDFAPYYVHLFGVGLMQRSNDVVRLNGPISNKVFDMFRGDESVISLIAKVRVVLTSDYLSEADTIALIREVGKYSHGDKLIEEGIARQGEYLQYYYAAYGFNRVDKTILKKLSNAANDPDPATAIGGVHGLRQWGNSDGDKALRTILEQGSNIAVKSHALGALLERTTDSNSRSKMLEDYLDANKSVSLRAVAVGHVPETDVERLQRIVDEDSSARVRTAALQRVGSISESLKTKRDKKAMRAWFLKVKARDSSPVIRSQARQFAKALE